MPQSEVDQVTRNWPQLLMLTVRLIKEIQKHSADGSVRLTRQQRKELIAEAREIQKTYIQQAETTQQWYQARTTDYQREAKAAHTRAAAGATPEEQTRATAYLSGLRASIEHTIHDAPLTAEQRGQVVQALDAIDNEPSKPVAHNVFETVTGDAAVRARYAAAANEHQVMQHRQRLTATEATAAQPSSIDVAELRRENARRFDDLASRIERLEHKIDELVPRETATTTAGSNGRPTARKTQQATEQAAAEPSSPRPRAEQRQQAEANPVASTVTTEEAEAELEQTEQPVAQPQQTAAAEQAEAEAPQTIYVAQMEAEA